LFSLLHFSYHLQRSIQADNSFAMSSRAKGKPPRRIVFGWGEPGDLKNLKAAEKDPMDSFIKVSPE
jgi:hypothetical protein